MVYSVDAPRESLPRERSQRLGGCPLEYPTAAAAGNRHCHICGAALSLFRSFRRYVWPLPCCRKGLLACSRLARSVYRIVTVACVCICMCKLSLDGSNYAYSIANMNISWGALVYFFYLPRTYVRENAESGIFVTSLSHNLWEQVYQMGVRC